MPKEKKIYTSLFDAVSEVEQDKTSKKIASEKMDEERKEAADIPQSGEDIKESFDRYKKLYELMHDKVDQMLGQKQLTRRILSDFFSAPRNFSSQQWQMIQDQKEEVEKMLQELLPHREPSTEQKDEAAGPPKKEKKEYKPKVMQVKSRWIPMR